MNDNVLLWTSSVVCDKLKELELKGFLHQTYHSDISGGFTPFSFFHTIYPMEGPAIMRKTSKMILQSSWLSKIKAFTNRDRKVTVKMEYNNSF